MTFGRFLTRMHETVQTMTSPLASMKGPEREKNEGVDTLVRKRGAWKVARGTLGVVSCACLWE